MQSTTHIAAGPIRICGRWIQRCAACGYKLCDSKGTASPVGPHGEVDEFPFWQPGRMVRVTEGNPTHFDLLPDTGQLPDDNCLELIE